MYMCYSAYVNSNFVVSLAGKLDSVNSKHFFSSNSLIALALIPLISIRERKRKKEYF